MSPTPRKRDPLNDAFDKLVKAGGPKGDAKGKAMSREEWIVVFFRAKVTFLVESPTAKGAANSSCWIVRVGSVWHRDEEYHVYAMESAVMNAAEAVAYDPQTRMMMVTPMWVFTREGNRMVYHDDHAVMGLANKNFQRLMDSAVRNGPWLK